MQPLLNDEEFERTERNVAEFGRAGGVGEELQKKLLKRAKIKDSWVGLLSCRPQNRTKHNTIAPLVSLCVVVCVR